MYYGQLELDKVLHETFFKERRNGFFVECGAYDGLGESTCKFFEESMGWKGMNIEPVPYTFERLIVNRPDSINVNAALSSTNGKAVFHNPIHPELGTFFGCGSLAHSEEHKKGIVGYQMDDFEVQTIKFSDLFQKHSLPDIDLFVLDVEGHEKVVLPDILTIPEHALPKVFCIEHKTIDNDPIAAMLAPWYNYHSFSYHNVFFVKR